MRPFHLIINLKKDYIRSSIIEIIINYSFHYRGTYTCNVNETLKTFSRCSAFGQKKKKKKKNFEFSLKTSSIAYCALFSIRSVSIFFPLPFFQHVTRVWKGGKRRTHAKWISFWDEIDGGSGNGVAGKTNSNEGHTSNAPLICELMQMASSLPRGFA